MGDNRGEARRDRGSGCVSGWLRFEPVEAQTEGRSGRCLSSCLGPWRSSAGHPCKCSSGSGADTCIEISSISQSREWVSHNRSWTVKEDLQGGADPNAEFLWESVLQLRRCAWKPKAFHVMKDTLETNSSS